MGNRTAGSGVQPGRVRSGAARGALVLTVGLATVAAGAVVPVSAANAAADTITVTSLGLGGNAGAGNCAATAGGTDCTLRGALEIANASTNPDGVKIDFAPSLAGTGQISFPGAVNAGNSMSTTVLNPGSENVANGARYVVDATVPVSIDFTNLDGIEDQDGSHLAGIYVKSDDVSLSNLKNMRAAESGIAVRGTGTVIDGVHLEDPTSPVQEVGVLLLDGASDTKITDTTIYSPYWGSVVVDNKATVTNTVIDGLVSRGVENWGHLIFEDDSVVNGFSVSNSTLGALEETSPSHGFFINPSVVATGVKLIDSTFQSPGKEGVHFFGGGQKLTGTEITGTKFVGTDAKNLGRVVSDNTATFEGLNFSDNRIDYAGGAVFSGSVSEARISGNTVTNTVDGGAAALQLGRSLDGVQVSGNHFEHIYAVDTIRVEGTSAKNVSITGNTLKNLNAAISRSAIRIDAPGTGNLVSDNTLTQKNDDPFMRADSFNHWAIYNSANAASNDASVGWAVTDNAIDGFGWNYLANREGGTQAPIVHNARGKLLVTGNTFGEHTRGSLTTDVEHSAYWFFWNVGDTVSNNTVQTYRADQVSIDGDADEATFTATKPAQNLIGNNDATAPVTLYVYWTADNHAEVFLGKVEDVNPGDRVTLPAKGRTGGHIRLQTVDANGNTSQYSSIDPNAESSIPAAPKVTGKDATSVSGTGTPGGTFTVRDESGAEVATGPIDDSGNWSATGLKCGTEYTVVQAVDGIESRETTFTTAACPTGSNASANGTSSADGADGTSNAGGSNANGTSNAKGADGTSNANGGNANAAAEGANAAADGTSANGTAAGTAGQSDASGDGSLPVTGSGDLGGLALGALALLVVGGGALLIARRRRA